MSSRHLRYAILRCRDKGLYTVEPSEATLERPRHRARRGALTQERILDAASALIDAHGMAGLTMRRLGSELGVDPMAVYHHVGGKRAIVLALVEQLFAGFAMPGTAGSWQGRVRVWARTYRDLALRRPGLVVSILGDVEAVGIAASRTSGPLVRALGEAGFGTAEAETAISVVVDYVHGAILPAATLQADWHDGPPSMPRPDDTGFAAAFDRGLDVIVAGLEVLAGTRGSSGGEPA